jgi:hypothetical protein
MKIRPVGAELFHADEQMDRRTDKTKIIIFFLNFAKAPKRRKKFRLCDWNQLSELPNK